MNKIIPRRARNGTLREQWRFWLIGLATVYEGLVIALSFGWFTVNTRAWLLFDAWED